LNSFFVVIYCPYHHVLLDLRNVLTSSAKINVPYRPQAILPQFLTSYELAWKKSHRAETSRSGITPICV